MYLGRTRPPFLHPAVLVLAAGIPATARAGGPTLTVGLSFTGLHPSMPGVELGFSGAPHVADVVEPHWEPGTDALWAVVGPFVRLRWDGEIGVAVGAQVGGEFTEAGQSEDGSWFLGGDADFAIGPLATAEAEVGLSWTHGPGGFGLVTGVVGTLGGSHFYFHADPMCGSGGIEASPFVASFHADAVLDLRGWSGVGGVGVGWMLSRELLSPTPCF